MKKRAISMLLCLLLCLSLFLSAPRAEAAGIPLNLFSPEMRDYAYWHYDLNHDEYLDQSEINQAKKLSLNGSGPSENLSLSGIEYLTALEELSLTNCFPSNLSLDYNQKLRSVELINCKELNVRFKKQPDLRRVNIINCEKLRLDVKDCPAMEYLNLTNDVLLMESLDISRCPLLDAATKLGERFEDEEYVTYRLNQYYLNYRYLNVSLIQAPYIYTRFVDVVYGQDWFFDPVVWAFYHQPAITSGSDETHFSPNNECTREQVMFFIWAASLKPAPADEPCPFSDVEPGAYYYDAIRWAVQNGVTGGIGDGKFGVGISCTREQVVTFLWKSAEAPILEAGEIPFSDVEPDQYYYNAVHWAVQNGVTGGIGDGKFGVGNSCTRSQVVTFLYKVYGV